MTRRCAPTYVPATTPTRKSLQRKTDDLMKAWRTSKIRPQQERGLSHSLALLCREEEPSPSGKQAHLLFAAHLGCLALFDGSLCLHMCRPLSTLSFSRRHGFQCDTLPPLSIIFSHLSLRLAPPCHQCLLCATNPKQACVFEHVDYCCTIGKWGWVFLFAVYIPPVLFLTSTNRA